MRSACLTFAVALCFCAAASAQAEFTGSPLTIDFTGFAGAGFVPEPAGGQLDSDAWRVTGMSDGNGTFGGTHTGGDFARGGPSVGGVTTGGVYAFTDSTTSPSFTALGLQPGGSDVTPGDITLRIKNNTASLITAVTVSYDIVYLNDQARGNSLNFAYSEDDTLYKDKAALDFTTPTAADASGWVTVARSTTLTELNVVADGFLFLQWKTDDVNGSGNRDEFGITNINVSISSILSICGLWLGASSTDTPITPIDRLFVDNIALGWPVTIRTVPTLQIPNDPQFNGLDLFFQVFMVNPIDFPKDPIQLSNGLKATIGGAVTPYGKHSGIELWAPMQARIGQAFQPAFKFTSL